MQITNRIFDGPSCKSKLWRKAKAYKMLKNSPVKFSSSAYKKTADGQSYVKRFFFVKEHHLLYKKREDSSKISGILNLDWTSVEFNVLEANRFGLGFEINFIKNGSFISVYLQEGQELRGWVNVLRRLCIQTDFKRKYKFVEYIDRGSFGQVIFF